MEYNNFNETKGRLVINCTSEQANNFFARLKKIKEITLKSYKKATDTVFQERYFFTADIDTISVVYETRSKNLIITATDHILSLLRREFDLAQKVAVGGDESRSRLPANVDKNQSRLPSNIEKREPRLPSNIEKREPRLPAESVAIDKLQKHQNKPINNAKPNEGKQINQQTSSNIANKLTNSLNLANKSECKSKNISTNKSTVATENKSANSTNSANNVEKSVSTPTKSDNYEVSKPSSKVANNVADKSASKMTQKAPVQTKNQKPTESHKSTENHKSSENHKHTQSHKSTENQKPTESQTQSSTKSPLTQKPQTKQEKFAKKPSSREKEREQIVKGVNRYKIESTLSKINAKKDAECVTDKNSFREGCEIYTISQSKNKLTLRYYADKFQAQLNGKDSKLFDEVLSMVSNAVKTTAQENELKVVQRKLKKMLPNAFDVLSEQSKADFSIGMIDISNDKVRLSDYSMLLVPPYRGLECLISDLQKLKGIDVKMIGQAYEKFEGKYVLKSGYRKRVNSHVYSEVMSALYIEYFEKRNFYAHSDITGDQLSRIISDKEEVKAIFNRLIELVEYNIFKLKEIRFFN